VATVDVVFVTEAEMRVDGDGVQVSPRVPVLETEQARAMRWGLVSMEEFCGRALSECDRVGRATRTCQVTVSEDTGMSETSGGRARGSGGAGQDCYGRGRGNAREKHRRRNRTLRGAAMGTK
jgi:hypothetical protein